MLTIDDVKKNIQTEMAELFVERGFKESDAKDLRYKLPYESGFKSCFFGITEHQSTFWIELSLGVRIHVVEQLANPYTLTLKDYYNDTHTILTSYGRMMGNNYFRFQVNNLDHLEDACKEMTHFLHTAGFPFLIANDSIYQIDQLINAYPERPSKFIYNQSHRCIKGIIVAKMCQNPHFNTLVKAYKFILEKDSLADKMRDNYMKLVQHLYMISLN